MITRLTILICLLFPLVSRAQTSVVLERGVRVDASQPVTLGDIARLSGDAAETLGAIVLIPDLRADHVSADPFDIDVDRVRQVLDRETEFNWALVSLTGSSCRLVPIDDAELEALRHIMTPAGDTPQQPSGPTLRDAVAWRLAAQFGVEPDDLRLGFDARNAKELAATTLGRQVEVTPTGDSDKMPLRYTVYSGDRIERSGNLMVQVAIRRAVVVANQNLSRGDIPDLTVVSVEERWVGPSVSPARARDVVGKEIRTGVAIGAVIEREAVDEPLVVERGDKVMIECVTGGFVVKSEAWALEDGRDGEVIKFKSVDDPQGKQPFNARLAGTGRAVAVVHAPIGPIPQEGT